MKEFHRRFKALLSHPVFWIDSAKRQALGEAFAEVIKVKGYTVYACAICGNHAHIVIRVHGDDALTMWHAFAEESRLRLRAASDISADHPIWAQRPYKVFLFTPEEVRSRIEYVEGNPPKEGLPRQTWEFVTPYDNWPLHKHKAK